MRVSPILAALALSACAAPAPAPPAPVELEQIWRVTGLANPESIVASADGRELYVSNVNGEADAHDGNGFIARVSASGEILDREWITGLHAPKGLARRGNLLYVADIDALAVFALSDQRLLRRVAAPGAGFLNDVAFAADGAVLAADSARARIYAFDGESASVWLEHTLLGSVNGLLPEADRLVVTTMEGRLLAIDWSSKAITILAEGLGDADGVVALSGGRYLVTAWPGEMFVVGADGQAERILDTRAEPRYLNDILLSGDTLLVPHWEPSELTAYRLRTSP